jgi:hypothetical protein
LLGELLKDGIRGETSVFSPLVVSRTVKRGGVLFALLFMGETLDTLWRWMGLLMRGD